MRNAAESASPRVARRVTVIFLAAIAGFTVLAAASRTQARSALTPAADTDPIFGVVFISSAEDRAPGSSRTVQSLEQQYQNGLATGATWNRWPLYWFNIEQNPGVFDWSTQDATILADMAHGLRLNAILLGTPWFYTTDNRRLGYVPRLRPGDLSLDSIERATPEGLYEPVFNDGTDVPGPGKHINLDNRWGAFVALSVERYRPGGVLAQANGWPAGVGVTHWEMWNEPDLDSFWDASVEDYARLLKVGYLAAKQIDPSAQVIFGALANNYAKLNYYRDVLAVFAADPQAAQFGFYHDILATHSYFHAWKSWYHVFRAGSALAAYGMSKPIWLNETGVPAWNDYPGPVWDPVSALRATTDEQAAYAIQSAFYALYAGADAYFHFQLYDGCGNQPGGTDFPPHNGELCDANGQYQGKPCAGDANGLYRNPTDASCFTQHPQPGSPRANRAAFQVLTTHLAGVEPYWRKREGAADACPGQLNPAVPSQPQEWIAFYREATKERIVGMWTLCDRQETAIIDATSPDGRATLIYPDGSAQPVAAVDGHYTIELPPATNRNPFPGQTINPLFPIGGRPIILIERDDRTPPELPYKGFLPAVHARPDPDFPG